MIEWKEFWDDAVESYVFAVDAAWDQHVRHPEFSRGICLRKRSFLCHILGEDCELLQRACNLAEETENKSDMMVLLPDLQKYMMEKFSHPKPLPSRCFRYALNDQHWCYIHICNPLRPDSFLDFPHFVADNLRHVMDLSEKENGCSVLFTATWMNSLDKFLRFFPEEWINNVAPANEDVAWTDGWQGQFVNRKGFLNRKTADYYLQTGRLKYTRCASHCSFENARAHLVRMGL